MPGGFALAFTPFLHPLPVLFESEWAWLLIPLCIAVAIVWKSIKCASMGEVPKEAALITGWIIVGMAGAAAALVVVVKVLER